MRKTLQPLIGTVMDHFNCMGTNDNVDYEIQTATAFLIELVWIFPI